MPLRFVILEHTVNGEAHFDLMLEEENEDLLRTLQLQNWPPPSPFIEIQRHRPFYLTHEGEVSGGRGVVRRVSGGHWNPADMPSTIGVFQPHDGEGFTLTLDQGMIRLL